ncbi:MAG TPA: ABC transporter permease, partial [Opitutaceae bacterium]
MDSLRSLWFRVKTLFRRRNVEAEMAEEMRLHLERRTQEKMADGLPSEAARQAAQREFGGLAQMQERCRDERRFLWLEQSAQDVRYAFRQLRRNPGFAATAVSILALGIGFNTAIFSVAYGVLWRPLPYPEPERLVLLQASQQTEKGPKLFTSWAPASFEALRERVTTLESLAAYSSTSAQLSGQGEPRQLSAVAVSPDFFAMLGIAPAQGRAFFTGPGAADDDRSVVITDRLWRTALNADPAIVGRFLTIDGVVRTVVGVLPAEFTFRPVTPMGPQAEADMFLSNRWPGDAGQSAFLSLLGRLRPGVSREQADAELTTLVNGSSIVPPGAMAAAGAIDPALRVVARTAGLQEYGTGSARTLLLVLLGAVALVLAIACVNVANLQMARLSARRGELSVRMALGAGRRRIVLQLLTEAVVLSLLGTALGVLLAQAALQFTLPLVPHAALPRFGAIEIDGRVIAFCLVLSCVSTLLVGLVPALRLGGVAFDEGLAWQTGAGRATGDRKGERLRTVLVAAQIALTLVLLVGAGLLIHSFVRLTGVSPGFDASGRDGVVQTMRVTLPPRLFDHPKQIQAFARGVLGRTQHLPGVRSASVINSAPFGRMFIQTDFSIEG